MKVWVKFNDLSEIYSVHVWKFHDFSIAQILREINFWDSRSSKSAKNTFRGCEFLFYEFSTF